MLNQKIQQTYAPFSAPTPHASKNRPKFSMLDDLQQLNEIINGPGANEDNMKAQEALQKAYNYMKGSQSDSSNDSSNFMERESIILNNNQKENESHTIAEIEIQKILKGFNQPRIVIGTKTIDLRQKPIEHRQYIRNYDNVQKWLLQDIEKRGSSYAEEGSQEGLFGKALHNKKKENSVNPYQGCFLGQNHQTFDSYKNKATPQSISSLKIKR